MIAYRTVLRGWEASVEVKKSKFIAVLCPAATEEEAVSVLEAERKKHYDAKHHCSAYLLYLPDGKKESEQSYHDVPHSSDDGEPSGTAGKPILEVLKGAGVKNAVCVVTRYFGGTLLGTGGLVRAYTDAARAVLEQAELVNMSQRERFALSFGYGFTGKADYLIQACGCVRMEAEYGQDVKYVCTVGLSQRERLYAELTEASAGQAVITPMEVDFYPE
ncbi:MAG: YigZ family protein [Lachnospiraceae bacterium]|nr:YigZ family protein [Lachnospiraceae bacterium]